ncbi:MAG: hypothetical protein GTN80_09710, partial [Nitrososphaeria archaeon]|nr:hypothetical protein [Nitrososphaeria archaeon]NIQ33897.1 hypothetical protein [Nitrososphaeria archaeon]
SDESDLEPKNNFAEKKVFVGIMFSALLPNKLEVNTKTGFGPFARKSFAHVNLTIATPEIMADVEIVLTDELSEVVCFVDPPQIGDVDGWAYFAFEIYASGKPLTQYIGQVQVVSNGILVNEVPINVTVSGNPVPKINSLSLNDTEILRVKEALGMRINATDFNGIDGYTSYDLTVSAHFVYYDVAYAEWISGEGPIPTQYNNELGLFELSYTFSTYYPTHEFRVKIEVKDRKGGFVTSMIRSPFNAENNRPEIRTSISPSFTGGGPVSLNITASDVETPIRQLRLTALVETPSGAEIPVELELHDGFTTATFNNATEEGTNLFIASAADREGGNTFSIEPFEVDNTSPNIRLTSPSDGGSVSGETSIAFTAWDKNLESISLFINGTLEASWVESGVQIHNWDTGKDFDGAY